MSFSATAVSPEIAHAINIATSSGVICVASAGNSAKEVLVYPGALRNVLGVGSTTAANPPTRSWFSNFGDALVSLGAPGEGVITTYPGGGYAAASGTSFSAPLTSGAAALLVQLDPTVNQAKADSLLGNADRMEAGMGKGRLNLDVAVRTLPDAAPPAVAMSSPVGGVLFGSVLVSASASDNVGVAGVKFLLDGSPLGAEVDRGTLRAHVGDDRSVQRHACADRCGARCCGQPGDGGDRQRDGGERHDGADGAADEPGRRGDARGDRDGCGRGVRRCGHCQRGVRAGRHDSPEATAAPYELAWNTATVGERRPHPDRDRARCGRAIGRPRRVSA